MNIDPGSSESAQPGTSSTLDAPGWVRVVVFILGGLLSVGAAFAAVVAVDLSFPGGPLDVSWGMADGKQGQFQELGVFGPLILLAIAAALSVAAIGLFLRRGWGRWLSVALLVVNLGPDVPGLFGGDWSILLFAVPVVALVVFLCSPPVSQVFARVPQGSRRPTEED